MYKYKGIYESFVSGALLFSLHLKIQFENNSFLCNYLPLVYTAMGDTI